MEPDNKLKRITLPFFVPFFTAVLFIVTPFAWANFVLTSSDITSGYLTIIKDGHRIRPGYTVSPGETIGLNLLTEKIWEGDSQKIWEGDIEITDVLGKKIAILKNIKIYNKKTYNSAPWLEGESIEQIATWKIPEDLGSGVYLVAADPRLYFVVRPKSDAKTDVIVLISSNTFNAYSTTEGKSFYKHPDRTPEVSFYRTMNGVKENEWMPFLHWLQSDIPFKNQQLGFIADIDMETENYLKNVHTLIVLGHSEYWTRKARETFDTFVEQGGNALVLSGNTMWWQVRYDKYDQSVLVGYKSNNDDPMFDTPLRTINWDRKYLDYPIIKSIGGNFPHGGYGLYRRQQQAIGQGGYWVVAPKHPVFKSTGLSMCDSIMFYKLREYDGMPILGLDSKGIPIPDKKQIGAFAFNFLAFDWGYRSGHTIGTMHIMRPQKDSGFVFHLGAKDFARTFNKGGKSYKKSVVTMKQIFINLIEYSESGEDIVLSNENERKITFPMTTPYKDNLTLQDTNFICKPHVELVQVNR